MHVYIQSSHRFEIRFEIVLFVMVYVLELVPYKKNRLC